MIKKQGIKINEETIKVIESFIQAKLPQEYRDFLLKYNGGVPNKGVFNLNNILSGLSFFYIINSLNNYSDFVGAYHLYKDRIPKGFIVVASDVGGNKILIGLDGENRNKIYFWDHENEVEEDEEPYYDNMTLIADGFNLFLNSLVLDWED